MHALIVVAHHHPRSHTCPRRPHRRRRSPRRPFRGNRRSGFGRLRAALQPGRPRRASRPGVASRRRPRRAGAHRSRRYPGAGLPDLLVVDAGPAQGLDRSRVLQWLGLRLQHRRRPAEKLQRLRVVLVGVGGADAGTFERHGYAGAMRTQIDHGIFDYCGARVVRSELLLESESADPAAHLEQARRIGAELFASARRPTPA